MTSISEPELRSRPRVAGLASTPFELIRAAPGWVLLGFAGSALVAVAGGRLGGGSVHWWLDPRIPPGGATNRVVLYAGMAAVAVAWLGLGRALSSRSATPGQVAVVAALWCLPLALCPPLFSRDMYSYLAQGTIVHLGRDPYHVTPSILGRLGQGHVLSAVDPFWRGTTAPYGPLFLAAVSVIVAIVGSNLVVGAMLVRLLAVVGLALVAAFLPRLARALGADPVRAAWLALLSPLVLFQLVAAGHNDLLMVGVMVAGVAFAVEGRPLVGVGLCALAATIKVPAGAAVIFILVTWARAEPTRSTRLRLIARGVIVAAAVIAAVGIVSGLGLGWISTAVFSTPSKVKLAVTPTTALGWTMSSVLHIGSYGGIESVLHPVAFGVAVLIALRLLQRSRRETMPRDLGLALIVFALAGPAAWPWYLAWGLVLLAACGDTQRSRTLAALLLVGAFLVKPGGIFVLPRGTSPIVLGFYLLAGVLAWYTLRRHADRQRIGELPQRRSALAER
jgi:alpha-1,6-mannosyltransferase